MQVKKFEARTVKEALELVKSQLGPDAIILNVRDHKKSYGLVGEGSVEITAAASEESIRKRRAVESRLPQQKREEFLKSSAKTQREIISQFVDHHQRKESQLRSNANKRYIDIDDEMTTAQAVQHYTAVQKTEVAPAQNEDSFFMKKLSKIKSFVPTQDEEKTALKKSQQQELEIIQSLQGEIKTLKQIISQFQHVPQKIQQANYPGSDYGLSFEFAGLFSKLTDYGVAGEIAADLLLPLKEMLPPMKLKNPALLEGIAAKNILDSVSIRQLPFASRIQVFMGPPGGGKLLRW